MPIQNQQTANRATFSNDIPQRSSGLEQSRNKPDLLANLMARAEFYACESMRKSNCVPSALFYIGPDNEGMFLPKNIRGKFLHDFADDARLMCVHKNASKSVIVLLAPGEPFSTESKLILFLQGESADGRIVRQFQNVICDRGGRFFKFGIPTEINNRIPDKYFANCLTRILPRKLPSAELRQAAFEELDVRGAIGNDACSTNSCLDLSHSMTGCHFSCDHQITHAPVSDLPKIRIGEAEDVLHLIARFRGDILTKRPSSIMNDLYGHKYRVHWEGGTTLMTTPFSPDGYHWSLRKIAEMYEDLDDNTPWQNTVIKAILEERIVY